VRPLVVMLAYHSSEPCDWLGHFGNWLPGPEPAKAR